jgi:hypothetical protein
MIDMQEGIQNSIKEPKVRKYGCYFLDLLQAVNPDMSGEEIIDAYHKSWENKWIDGDCTVYFANKVATRFGVHPELRNRPTNEYLRVEPERDIQVEGRRNGYGGIWIAELGKPQYKHFVLLTENPISVKDKLITGQKPNYNFFWDSLGPRKARESYVITGWRHIF